MLFAVRRSFQKYLHRSTAQHIRSVSTVKLAHAEYVPEGDVKQELSPLVILHGLCGSKNNWHLVSRKLVKQLDRKVLAVDARNHGESAHAPSMQYREMALDVAALLDSLNIQKVHLLGHSMGGRIVMTLALLKPELLASLIVEDSSPKLPSGIGSRIRMYLEVLRTLDMSLPDGSIANLRKRAILALEDVESHMGVRTFLAQNIIAGDKPGEAVWRFNIEAIYNSIDGIIGWDNSLDGLKYSGPSLFVGGDKSPHQPSGEFSELQKTNIESYFPPAQYHMVSDAGHWIHSEQPEAFIDCVSNFLTNMP